MADQFSRTRLLVGDEPLARLAAAKVAVFGVGGVGGFCVEALARAGVGTLHLLINYILAKWTSLGRNSEYL